MLATQRNGQMVSDEQIAQAGMGRRQFIRTTCGAVAGAALLGVAGQAQAMVSPGGTLIYEATSDQDGRTKNFTLNLKKGERFRIEFNSNKTVQLRRWKRHKLKRNYWKTDYTLSNGDVITAKHDHTKNVGRMAIFDLPARTVVRIYKVS